MSSIPFPDEQYLVLVGRLAYSASYAEGLILFDLPHLPGLPPELSTTSLESRTTGQIADHIEHHLDRIDNRDVAIYLEACSEGLRRIRDLRNDLLHARPATTVDGLQRLLRRLRDGEPFWITDEWIESSIELLDQHLSEMKATRYPLPD